MNCLMNRLNFSLLFLFLFFSFLDKAFAFEVESYETILGVSLNDPKPVLDIVGSLFGAGDVHITGDASTGKNEMFYANKNGTATIGFYQTECSSGFEISGNLKDVKNPPKLDFSQFNLSGIHLGLLRKDIEKVFPDGKTADGYDGELDREASSDIYSYNKKKDFSYMGEGYKGVVDDVGPTFTFVFNQKDELIRIEVEDGECI